MTCLFCLSNRREGIIHIVLINLNNSQILLKWFAQLVLAVDYLHSNYVLHRDLKVSGNK
jgi:serine/threonine protein kinase